ncbi:IS21 family transposase [Candidatus Poribacteria bacterium]|nr:IS21 family transposase [Candidatus Poribacteria bacterium]
MVKVEERERIRRAYFIEKKTIRWIAREYGHSRRVVRQALKESGIPVYRRKQPFTLPVIGPYVPIIEQWLLEDEGVPVKQRHTAHRIYVRLAEEHSFTGCESNVRRYVRGKRPKFDAVFVPIEHGIGEEAQVDFGEAQVCLGGQRTTVHLLCFQLCYSGRRFVRAYRTERQEAFFDGLAHALRAAGGVPKRITFDNPKTLVKKVFRGHLREEHPDFIAFRSHYLFEANFCNPARGNEKGHVEGLVGCVRRNALVPIPEVGSLSELNRILEQWCISDQARLYQGERVSDRFERERSLLSPLPPFDYPCCRREEFSVGSYSEVRVGTNRYSVPVAYAHRRVTVLAYPEKIEVLCRGEVIARHERCYGQNQDILDPYHYIPLLERRPALLDHGKAFKGWPLPAIFEIARRRLQESRVRGARDYIRILRLHDRFTTDQIGSALKQAEELGCLGADEVEMLLLKRIEPPPTTDGLSNLDDALTALRVEAINLQRFNELVEVSA